EYQARFPNHRDLIAAVYQQTTQTTAPQEGAYSTKDVASATKDVTESWFYMRNRLPVGPFTFDQLKKLALSGDLRPKDLVSMAGTVDWLEAGSILGLFSGPHAGTDAKQPEAGQWIRDEYVLLEAVGRGGMGEVF